MDRSADNLGQVINGIQRDLEELKAAQTTGGGGGGVDYVAGDGITIFDNTISADTTVLATKTDLEDYVESDELATVATTGSYNDLTDRPTVLTAYTYNFTATTDGAGFIPVPLNIVNKTTGYILAARVTGATYAFALPFSDAESSDSRYTLCIRSWDMSVIANTSVNVDIMYYLD